MNLHTRDFRHEREQFVAQRRHLFQVFLRAAERPDRRRKAGDSGHPLCAGANALFLPAAEHIRLNAHAFVYVKRTDAFRAVDFVGADA